MIRNDQAVHKYGNIRATYLRESFWKKEIISPGRFCSWRIDDRTFRMKSSLLTKSKHHDRSIGACGAERSGSVTLTSVFNISPLNRFRRSREAGLRAVDQHGGAPERPQADPKSWNHKKVLFSTVADDIPLLLLSTIVIRSSVPAGGFKPAK